MTPTMPTLTPAASTSTDAWTFGHSTRRPGRLVDEVGRKKRKPGACGRRLDRAARVVAERLARPYVIDGPEIELVIADDRGRVAKALVRVDDDRAFAQVRFDAALKRVARIDEQHGAAIRGACRAQVAQIAAEKREAALAITREHIAMEVRRADDGQRDDVRRRFRGGDARRAAQTTTIVTVLNAAWPAV